MPKDGELTLLVEGRKLSGWQEIRVSRGIERCPSDFDITLTERFPGDLDGVTARPGSACQVLLGQDVVITGYIDRYAPSIDRGSHRLRVLGRGRCQDLVDCAAWLRDAQGQLMLSSTKALAEQLCKPFGIGVTALDGDGLTVPQFNVILTESPWDIIERIARHSALLAYEGADGNLRLARAGTDRMASGFRQGINVEAASASFGIDQRFSLYEVLWTGLDVLSDIGRAAGSDAAWNQRARVADITVGADRPGTGRRFRPKVVVSDQDVFGQDIALQRALWERNRRNGRSCAVSITVDTWRDAAGRLWEPNTLASVHIPALEIRDAEWLIAEVTYSRGAEGTHAELLLMPREAFDPEPIVLQPYDPQVAAALRQGATP